MGSWELQPCTSGQLWILVQSCISSEDKGKPMYYQISYSTVQTFTISEHGLMVILPQVEYLVTAQRSEESIWMQHVSSSLLKIAMVCLQAHANPRLVSLTLSLY